jgi:PAS domain S-box-containing protein
VSEDSSFHVLVIDDDADTRANLFDILGLDGYQVEATGSVKETLAIRDWSRIGAIILDRKLPDGTAEDLLPRLKQLTPGTAVLIVTGYSDLQGAIAALRQGAADYIIKPINPEALRASLQRVAEHRRLTLDKARSDAAFRTLIDTAPCLILILREDHTLLYFNRFAEELTGYSAGEVVGLDYTPLFVPEEFRGLVNEQIRRVLEGQVVRGVENPVRCRDGTSRWVLWNAQRLPDYEGGPAILAIGQDISALKKAQDRTLQAERLAAIGQMVTGLAHESGNALARSQACLEMLELEVQDRPEALQLLGRVQRAQNHLQQLYEEVRNYAAPLKLDRNRWPLDSIWRQAWANLAGSRQGRVAEMHEDTSGLDLRCSIDPFRLEQVFRNIFENSLAACRDPVVIGIEAKVSRLDDRPALTVVVRDNGPGLDPDQRQRIFEPFYTTKTKGTGLGMAIAKRIIEAHGGRIAVGTPSARGEGSKALHGAELRITLPRESS